MAQFNFSTAQHSEGGAASLEDPIRLLTAQLLDLGHQVVRSEWVLMPPPVINILFEGFAGAGMEILRGAHGTGCILVCIATEQPTMGHRRQGWTWNHNPPDGDDYQRSMAQRCRVFPEACKYLDAVFTLVPGTERWYRHHHKNVHGVELGYSPRLMVPPSDHVPDADWSFYGTMSAHRHKVIENIGEAGMTIRVGQGLLPQEQRDNMVTDAKGVLHIKQHRNWQIMSSARCAVALHRRRFVFCADPVGVVEHVGSAYRDVVAVSPSHREDVVTEWARGLLKKWEYVRDMQVKLFQQTMGAQRCLGNALAASKIVELALA